MSLSRDVQTNREQVEFFWQSRITPQGWAPRRVTSRAMAATPLRRPITDIRKESEDDARHSHIRGSRPLSPSWRTPIRLTGGSLSRVFGSGAAGADPPSSIRRPRPWRCASRRGGRARAGHVHALPRQELRVLARALRRSEGQGAVAVRPCELDARDVRRRRPADDIPLEERLSRRQARAGRADHHGRTHRLAPAAVLRVRPAARRRADPAVVDQRAVEIEQDSPHDRSAFSTRPRGLALAAGGA